MEINTFLTGRMYMIGVFILAFMISCSKDDGDGILIQDHDDSEMMTILHSMMRSMDSLTLTNDPDIDFSNMMKVHLKGGIAMGNLEMEKGNDPFLVELASQMITQNQKDIVSLDSFVLIRPLVVSDSRYREQAETALEIMSNNADLQLLTGNMDHDFAILLIQHHLGALDLVDLQIQFGISAELKAISRKIKNNQQKEVQLLQDWLLE